MLDSRFVWLVTSHTCCPCLILLHQCVHIHHTGQLNLSPLHVCRLCCSSLLQSIDDPPAHTTRQRQGAVSCCAATDDCQHLRLGRQRWGCSDQGCASLSPSQTPCCSQIPGSEICAGCGKVQCLHLPCRSCAFVSMQTPLESASTEMNYVVDLPARCTAGDAIMSGEANSIIVALSRASSLQKLADWQSCFVVSR